MRVQPSPRGRKSGTVLIMIDPRVASGLRDLLPAAAIPRERMLTRFREVFARYGFVPIETPHIERLEVLTGKGAGSEEVLRQIFDVTNKGGEEGKLALRFDLTVPLARFVAKNVDALGLPFKRYAIGSVFRGERPAKGRFREFTQCDFDIVGTTGAVADAETVQVIHDALDAAGAPEFRIAINNRKVLDGLLEVMGVSGKLGPVLRSLDKLVKAGREKVRDELTRGEAPLLSPEQADRVLAFAEKGRGGVEVLDALDAEVVAHPKAAEGIANLREVLDLLKAGDVPEGRVVIDLGLARGLDYYTGVVFETTVVGWEGFGSVASGGRYDNLASLFTNRQIPGVGASIGLDRLLALMQEAGALTATAATAPVLVARFPGVPAAVSVKLASRLRKAGIGAEVFPDEGPLGKQLGFGSNRGHRFGLIVGPDEAAGEVFNLRDLATRQEIKGIPWSDLEEKVREALDGDGGRGAG